MPKKILVVDDDLHMIHIICFKLRQVGYEVISANNGRDGYALACEHLPDAVVTDFQMPLMDGFEMAMQLYSNSTTSKIPIVLLTARSHKLPHDELSKTHIKSTMPKPFSALQLVENLAEVLAAHESDQEDAQRDEGHAA